MAAVTNLTDHLSTLHLQIPEGKTAPAEVAKPTTYKTHAYICTAERLNGAVRIEYAVGEIKIFEEVASLKFTASEEPPKEMTDFLNAIKIPTIDDFFDNDQVFQFHQFRSLPKKIGKVTTVIVNVRYSYPAEGSSAVGGIGTLCQSAFKNMKPWLSSVNVQYGYQHWTTDSILSPGKDMNIKWKKK